MRAISDCRCPEPLRTWHAALQSAEPPDLDGIPASYTLAPLRSARAQEAERLASRGLVAIERSRLAPLGRDRYAVIDVDELQSRRRELVHLVAPPDGSVQDLPADVLDLFVVARAADAVSDLLRVPGLYPAPAVLSAIEFATQGSRTGAASRRPCGTATRRGNSHTSEERRAGAAHAIDVVTESSRDRLRFEAAAAYRNAVFPTAST